jgi:uncharacterized protein YndB with AHSA1/START domain
MATPHDFIKKNVLLHAPRARVWRALTDAQEFGSWFGVRLDGPFVQGKSVQGRVVPTTADAEQAARQKAHEGVLFQLHVERLEPERLFSFRWQRGRDYSAEPTTLVTFELEEADGGVLLTVTESGFDAIPLERRAAAFSSNEQGWAMQMKLIEKYLAQHP